MKIIMQILLVLLAVAAGYAVGFPVGKSAGFSTGSEWALVQADLIAKEAGVFMPVRYEQGTFRVAFRQPNHLYKRAWKLADLHEQKVRTSQCEGSLKDTIRVTRTAYLTQ